MSTPPGPIARNPRLLDEATLTVMIAAGEIDTVIVAFTDMQGRLQGKRLHAEYFLDEVLGPRHRGLQLPARGGRRDEHRARAMRSRPGRPGTATCCSCLDTDTMRLLPHLPGTAMVQCDLAWLDGADVRQSPRSILRRQLDRAAAAGYVALAGTELEFILFGDTYEQAWDAGYRNLTPANQYNVDYSILGTSRVEPLLRDIRNTMYSAGMTVESAKGECNFGQHEIAFRYADVLTTADNHAVYRNSAKEIAEAHGRSLTFMAKFDEREGNSCHIHLSLRGTRRLAGVLGPERAARTPLYDHFVAGRAGHHARVHPAVCAEHQLLQAVRRRLVRADGRGLGQRQPHLRGPAGRARRLGATGEPGPRRGRQPLPGAWPAMMAGGLHGIENELDLPAELIGNAYESDGDAGAADAAGGPGSVRRIGGRAGRLRRRRRRSLRARRRHRDRGVRRRRHRLGTSPRLRAPVSPAPIVVRSTCCPTRLVVRGRAIEGCGGRHHVRTLGR